MTVNADVIWGFVGTIVVALILRPMLLSKNLSGFPSSRLDKVVGTGLEFFYYILRVDFTASMKGLFFGSLIVVAIPTAIVGVIVILYLSRGMGLGIIVAGLLLGALVGRSMTQPPALFK